MPLTRNFTICYRWSLCSTSSHKLTAARTSRILHKVEFSVLTRTNIICNMIVYKVAIFLVFIIVSVSDKYVSAENDEEVSTDLYVVEGKVFPWENKASNGWQLMTHVMVNGGEHYGFLREDGTFIISNVPSGSYVIEIVNPNCVYEPVRVEINSKGRFRARKVNLIQTSQVIQIPYPLKMRPLTPFRYFQVREQWKVTDFLFNSMVLMMILPLLLLMIGPKIMNDPDARKEMEHLNNLTKYKIPEMSELITSFLSGEEKQKPKAVKAAKKRQ